MVHTTEAAGLLFREEGLSLICYFTIPKTRESGALGSILVCTVRSPERKAEFIRLMQSALVDMLKARDIPYAKWRELRTETVKSNNNKTVLPSARRENLNADAGRLTRGEPNGQKQRDTTPSAGIASAAQARAEVDEALTDGAGPCLLLPAVE